MSLADNIHEHLLRLGAQDLADALGLDRVSAAVTQPRTFQEHPFRRLLMTSIAPRRDDLAYLALLRTADGAMMVRRVGWDEWLRTRLETACASDHKNSEGALAEVRAAGALLRTEMTVRAVEVGGAPTADLSVSIGVEAAVIEITCKSINDAEGGLLRAHLSQPPEPSATGVSFSEHEVFPAGRPRGGECTAENVAQKLAQKKEGARQAAGDLPSVLWVDLQSEWWAVQAHGVQPFTKWRGELYSYGIWHGFYGRKDVPIFEGHVERHGGPFGVWRQRFDGLLIQRTEWSAAVISLPSITVLYESPWAENPIGPKLRESLMSVPDADFTASWAQWGSVPLKQIIEAEWDRLEFIAKRDHDYLRRQLAEG